jgi:hypothetical protein
MESFCFTTGVISGSPQNHGSHWWNAALLLAVPIPLGKPKEKRSKRNSLSVEALAKAGHPVVSVLFELSS